MSDSAFWNDSTQSNKLMQELKALKGVVEPFGSSEKRVAEAVEFLELAAQDEGIQKQLAKAIPQQDRFFYETCLVEINYNSLLSWFQSKKDELTQTIASVQIEGLEDIRQGLSDLASKVDSAVSKACSETTCEVVDAPVDQKH